MIAGPARPAFQNRAHVALVARHFGVFAASLGFLVLPMLVPSKAAAGEIMIEVAPQPAHEVPLIDDTFQTSVRHLYLIGEAAGTASINLAMRSGRQVIEAIAAELKQQRPPVQPDLYDVAIIGCGPAGLGATATAQALGLKYVTLEKMTPASTLRAYPRAKFVQATPIDIDEYGTFFLEGDNSREELIREWERIIAKLKLTINDRQEIVDIVREPEFFRLRTAPRRHLPRALRGPRDRRARQSAPSESCPVTSPAASTTSLIDADEYRGREILVVGGGNAGAEVAQALADPRLGNRVTYSFRAPVLSNVSRENVEKIGELQRAQRLTVYPATVLDRDQARQNRALSGPATAGHRAQALLFFKQPVELDNELIFALIGAELPAAFLKKIGVRMGSKGRSALTSSSSQTGYQAQPFMRSRTKHRLTHRMTRPILSRESPMPHITTDDGVKLYYEEAGAGLPIVFVHEFAGDARSYESQLRYFSRRYRCIAFNARGYPPSDVPEDPEKYSQARARDDIRAVVTALGLDPAARRGHLDGRLCDAALRPRLSIGGAIAGRRRMRLRRRARTPRTISARVRGRRRTLHHACRWLKPPTATPSAPRACNSRTRIRADGRNSARCSRNIPPIGSALTLRGVQKRRPSLYDLTDALKQMTPAGPADDRRRGRALPRAHADAQAHDPNFCAGRPAAHRPRRQS